MFLDDLSNPRNISIQGPTMANNTTDTNFTPQNPDSHRLHFLPWGNTPPIPDTSLSASGLLVLADLSTIAKRTVLTGTSSWFDAFVLAPGLHQQQHCEALSSTLSSSTSSSTRSLGNRPCTIRNTDTGIETEVTNTAMLGHLHRMVEGLRRAKSKGGRGPSRGVTLYVGSAPQSTSTSSTTQTITRNLGLLAIRHVYSRAKERGILKTVMAPLLYAFAPVLTALSMSLMLAMRDWWGVGTLVALIIARALNIWIIRSRISHTQKIRVNELPPAHCGIVCSLKRHPTMPKDETPVLKAPILFLPPPSTLDPVSVDNMAFDGRALVDGPGGSFSAEKGSTLHIEKLAEVLPSLDKASIPAQYLLNLPGSDAPVRIQGFASDMETLLSGSWMREKTNVEGYMEAIAKVLVYGVAAVSGNMKQSGNIILGGLLIVSAGTLALANTERAGSAEDRFGGKVFRVDDVNDMAGEGEEKRGKEARAEKSAC